MGTFRQIQSSRSQPDWMVVPDNDLSDIFIGGHRYNRGGNFTMSLRSPKSGRRSHHDGKTLKNVFVEEHSKPHRNRHALFENCDWAGFELNHDEDHPQPMTQSLTSQILSELHRRGKSKKNVSASFETPRLDLQSSRRDFGGKPGISTVQHRSARQHADSNNTSNRSGSALNFADKSLALSIVRSRSAVNNRYPEQRDSSTSEPSPPIQSPRSNNSLSPRDAESTMVNGARPGILIVKDEPKDFKTNYAISSSSIPTSTNVRGARHPRSSKSKSVPSSAKDHFGSRDSGIFSTTEPDTPAQSPSYHQTTSNIKHKTNPKIHIPSDTHGLPPDSYVIREERFPEKRNKPKNSKDRPRHCSGEEIGHTEDNDSVSIDSLQDSAGGPASPKHGNGRRFVERTEIRGERVVDNGDKGKSNDEEEEEDDDKGEDEDEDELPEYLDSFQSASSLTFRRPSLWNKVRDIGASTLIHDFGSTRTASSLGNSIFSGGVGGSSIHSNDAHDDSGRRGNKRKRCPNCGEELQRAPTQFVAVKGNEKNFLTWLLGNWGKSVSTY